MMCVDATYRGVTYKVKLPYEAMRILVDASEDLGALGVGEDCARMVQGADIPHLMDMAAEGVRGSLYAREEQEGRISVGCYEV